MNNLLPFADLSQINLEIVANAIKGLRRHRKFDPDFKKQWMAGLLNPEYLQARGSLCKLRSVKIRGKLTGESKRGYCCLGLAMKLQGYTPQRMGSNGMPYTLHPQPQTCELMLGNGGEGMRLESDMKAVMGLFAELNDIHKFTFQQIATVIRDNF